MSLTALEATSLETVLKTWRDNGATLALCLKRLPKGVVDGVQFATEPVGGMVDVQWLSQSDPGGAAKLVSVSGDGALIKYTISKFERTVEPARVRNISDRMTASTASGTRAAASASARQ